MFFSVEQILNITEGVLLTDKIEVGFETAIIDSRESCNGALFFPLKGEKTDGHNYIIDALERGASGSFLSKEWLSKLKDESFPEGKVVFVVNDVLESLHKLALYHRNRFSIPVVAVTGSNGKTTTKDLITAVLSTSFCILKTEGNYNNQLGLPLTLLKLNKSHQMAVVELGMSGVGEIARLTSLCRPTVGVITNIGEAHLEMLGSKENIARAKGELLEIMGPEGEAILNGDDPFLRVLGDDFPGKVCYYGFQEAQDLQALDCHLERDGYSFNALLPDKNIKEFWIPLPGKYNVYNALAAIAVGFVMHLELSKIEQGLAKTIISKMRMERVKLKNNCNLINDAYNANPTSMKCALEVLQELNDKTFKIAVLGEMFELGMITEEGHLEVGRFIARLDIDYLITVGEKAFMIAKGALEKGFPEHRVFQVESCERALAVLESIPLIGAYILIKGSRGMEMEGLVEELIAKYN